jgi:hypothetical protein
MEYLAKFDDAGRRKSTVIRGVHYTTDTERKKYIGDGYIPISDEDYQTYIGNRGTGDNGTGYIRDAKTGKPVSAPPTETEPQEMDVQPIPETELAVMEGMVNIQTRLAAIEAKLKGGE